MDSINTPDYSNYVPCVFYRRYLTEADIDAAEAKENLAGLEDLFGDIDDREIIEETVRYLVPPEIHENNKQEIKRTADDIKKLTGKIVKKTRESKTKGILYTPYEVHEFYENQLQEMSKRTTNLIQTVKDNGAFLHHDGTDGKHAYKQLIIRGEDQISITYEHHCFGKKTNGPNGDFGEKIITYDATLLGKDIMPTQFEAWSHENGKPTNNKYFKDMNHVLITFDQNGAEIIIAEKVGGKKLGRESIEKIKPVIDEYHRLILK